MVSLRQVSVVVCALTRGLVLEFVGMTRWDVLCSVLLNHGRTTRLQRPNHSDSLARRAVRAELPILGL